MTDVPTPFRSIQAPQHIHDLLARLHEASLKQERERDILYKPSSESEFHDYVRDKFVALEQDRCQLAYLLARSTGAKHIVEAGTSFGVSTIYLALAVGQNVADAKARGQSQASGRVIATENEETKAALAQEHWKEAGGEVEPWIDLKLGDLRETLKAEGTVPEGVDMLLLDIWTPMALPTLEIVRPKLRPGAIVLIDNITRAAKGYHDLIQYLQNETNGFQITTLPYDGGLGVAIYLPKAVA